MMKMMVTTIKMWECCKIHLLHCALVPICAAITRAHLHNIDDDDDYDAEKEDYDDACDDDDETMQMKIHMMMTGVTISRQDPGATQAQEASRCASTLNKFNLHYFNQIHHRQIKFAFIKLKD